MRYHVFIEGCRDVTPEGLEHLASALGQRYGMSPPAVVRRLREGRFCARASLDLASAQRLTAELEAVGAHASVIADGPSPTSPRYESGLAAAFAGDHVRDDVGVELGPLAQPVSEETTDIGWELADVDGAGEPAAASRSRARGPQAGSPPLAPAGAARPFAPGPPPPPPMPATARGRDPFAPPDAESSALPELAELPTRVEPAPLPPPPSGAAGAWTPPPRSVSTTDVQWQRPGLSASWRETLERSPRARFAAGVAIAFLVGLVPAQIVAQSRATSAYDDIRARLRADYDAADTPQRWATLEVARADALDLARTRMHRLAISSCLIWLAVAGAAGFVWFRVIDWPEPQP